MPTYVYKCSKCQNTFEEVQRITAEPLTACNQAGCDGVVHRVISAGAGIIFKGSGFYQTDYRSESYKKDASADGATSAGKSDSTHKTESKSAVQGSSSAGKSDSASKKESKPAAEASKSSNT